MKLLFDTHIFIWAYSDPKKLSEPIRLALKNSNNEFYISVVSIWEIRVKSVLGKIDISLPVLDKLINKALQDDVTIIELDLNSVKSYNLPLNTLHKDPFDRMIIWQAIHFGYTIISMDKKFRLYEDVTSLKILS